MDETPQEPTQDEPQQVSVPDSVVITSVRPHPEPHRVAVTVTVTIDNKEYVQDLNIPDNEDDILVLVERYAQDYKEGLQTVPEPQAAAALQDVVGTEIEVT